MIRFQKVQKYVCTPNGRKEILHDLTFDVPRAKITTIFGPNGSGKSSLMNIIAGLDQIDGGKIIGLEALLGKIGYVFQDYRRTLLPWLTVEQNILFPLHLRGLPKVTAKNKLQKLLTLTGIQIDLQQSIPTLSGGQAQLVCLLRALIIDPELLILDEPFSALDYGVTLILREQIQAIAAKLNLTVLWISHDLEEALYLGDQLVLLHALPAQVVQIFPISFARPRSLEILTSAPFVALKAEVLQTLQSCGGLWKGLFAGDRHLVSPCSSAAS
jgi:NitT/TauT family transport system ATP-binding protein